MRKILLFSLLFLAGYISQSQVGYLRYDTLKVLKNGGNAELVLLNRTKDTLGFLYNTGNGVTKFSRVRKINDSSFTVGADTIRLRLGTGGGSGTDSSANAGYGITKTTVGTVRSFKADTATLFPAVRATIPSGSGTDSAANAGTYLTKTTVGTLRRFNLDTASYRRVDTVYTTNDSTVRTKINGVNRDVLVRGAPYKIKARGPELYVIGTDTLGFDASSLPSSYNNYIRAYSYGVSKDSSASVNKTHMDEATAAAVATGKYWVFLEELVTINPFTIPSGVKMFATDTTKGLKLASGVSTNTKMVTMLSNTGVYNMRIDGNTANGSTDTKLLGTDSGTKHIEVKGCVLVHSGTNAMNFYNTDFVDVIGNVGDSIGGHFFFQYQGQYINVNNNFIRGSGQHHTDYAVISIYQNRPHSTRYINVNGNTFINKFGSTSYLFESGGITTQLENVNVLDDTYDAKFYNFGGVSIGADSLLVDNLVALNTIPSLAFESSGSYMKLQNSKLGNGNIQIAAYLNDTNKNIIIRNIEFKTTSNTAPYATTILIGTDSAEGVIDGLEIDNIRWDAEQGNAYSFCVFGFNSKKGKLINAKIHDVKLNGGAFAPVGFYFNMIKGGDDIQFYNNEFKNLSSLFVRDTGIFYKLQVKENYIPQPTALAGYGFNTTNFPNYKLINNITDTARKAELKVNDITFSQGAGSPEGAIVAAIGSTYSRTDGGTGTSFYVKESGTGNTGWVAVAPGSGGGTTNLSASTTTSLLTIDPGAGTDAVIDTANNIRAGGFSAYQYKLLQGKPRVFNVKTDYGAVGDSTTNDATAIQAAINAAHTAGGGIVYFPNGFYRVGNSIITTVGGRPCNCQLYIPYSSDDSAIVITFEGETPGNFESQGVVSTASSKYGVIIESSLSTATAGDALIAEVKGPGSGTFDKTNHTDPTFLNINFRVRRDAGAIPLTGMNLRYASKTKMDYVKVDINTSLFASPDPTGTGSYGIILPEKSNHANLDIGTIRIAGFDIGLDLGEHSVIKDYQNGANNVGMLVHNSDHSSSILNFEGELNKTNVRFDGEQEVFIGQFNTEHYNGVSGAKWFEIVQDVTWNDAWHNNTTPYAPLKPLLTLGAVNVGVSGVAGQSYAFTSNDYTRINMLSRNHKAAKIGVLNRTDTSNLVQIGKLSDLDAPAIVMTNRVAPNGNKKILHWMDSNGRLNESRTDDNITVGNNYREVTPDGNTNFPDTVTVLTMGSTDSSDRAASTKFVKQRVAAGGGGGGGGSNWTVTGSDIWRNSKVGIGVIPTNIFNILGANSSGDHAVFKNNTAAGFMDNAIINNTDNGLYHYAWGSSASGSVFGVAVADAVGIFSSRNATASPLLIGTTGADNLFIGTNNITRMSILSDGKVGIGSITPTSIFDVNTTTSGGDQVRFKNGNAADYMYIGVTNDQNKQLALISYGSAAAGTLFGVNRANANVIMSYDAGGSTGIPLSVGTFGSANLVLGTNNTERFKIDASGNQTFTLGSDATGDIWYRNSSGYMTRLAIGTAAQHLVGGTIPAWRDTAVVSASTTASIVYSNETTGVTASSALTYTTANDGVYHTYRFNAYTKVTTVQSGAVITTRVEYTDRDGDSQTSQLAEHGLSTYGISGTTKTSSAYPDIVFSAAPNTVITMRWVLSGVSSAQVWTEQAILEKLR